MRALPTTKVMIASVAYFLCLNSASHAAVSADEAKQLGGAELTSWGAEKAGSKDGTIPAYSGERPTPPASFDPKKLGVFPDPYANEKPLYSITAQNMGQYANVLTDGQRALFQKYPSYRMDVYPTHRTAAHSEHVLKNTAKNATSCKATNNGLRLEGCYGGFPFPIPKDGNEAIWDHLMSHPANAWAGSIKTYIIESSGRALMQAHYEVTQEAVYLDPANNEVLPSNTVYWKLRFDAVGPARRIGEKTVILDALDPINPGRRAWTYIPGQRRVKLAPDLAYDTPSPAAGGASTMDEQRLFLGAQDRYDMKLMGKKNVLMMYNNYKLSDDKVCPDEVVFTKNFLNPDCIRWELHRAWVIQATLKPGYRHILPKRVLYFDEDSWAAGMGDSWDASGKLFRIDNMPNYAFYSQPYGQIADSTATYDLQTGIVAMTGAGYHPIPHIKDTNFFSPEALAGEGIR